MPSCNAPAANGPCSRPVPDADSHCFIHSGNGPPSSHGAPEGSQNALGNEGGGAPKNNLNAATHCGWSDPLKHYERLREIRPPVPFGSFGDGDDRFDDAFEWVQSCVDELVDDYTLMHDLDPEEVREDEEVMRKIREIAALSDQCLRTSLETLINFTVEQEQEYETADGEIVTVTTETINPSWRADIRTSQRQRNLWHELGIVPRDVAEVKDQHEQIAEALNGTEGDLDQDDDGTEAVASDHVRASSGVEDEHEETTANEGEGGEGEENGKGRGRSGRGIRTF